MQFIIVALSAYPTQASGNSFLKKPNIPLRKLAYSAAMFYTVNMLNNWAFAFNISVPVHIILRSFGSVTTMAAGWIRGKKYSPLQVLSVVVLTAGVVISAWADALTKVRFLVPSKSGEGVDQTAGQEPGYQQHQLYRPII
jgi:drug/metabolite transporter (DMT)-like permease